MATVSSEEAAIRLHITAQRVRELLRAGLLDGKQIARGQWLIDNRSIAEYEQLNSGTGRRWSAETSWALLDELDGHRAQNLNVRTAARVRERIRNTDTDALARKVATRTTTHTFAADDRKRTAAELILTGRSAAEQIGTNLVSQKRIVEGYLADATETVESFARRHLLIADSTGDVVIFDRPAYIQFADDRAGDAVVAADLARSTDTRERSAGLNALDRMRRRWLAAHTK